MAQMDQNSSNNKPWQYDKWSGEFGDQYVSRNSASEENIKIRQHMWQKIFSYLDEKPETMLECGCNVGMNQRALKRIGNMELFAIEPNDKARDVVMKDNVLDEAHVKKAFIDQLPFADKSMEFVFTSGVLIHVPPEKLQAACSEIYRVSNRYIAAIEYFSQKPEEIPYRGNEGMLFKRDFGSYWLDLYPDLKPIECGFFWKRTTGMDDATWWLFEKP